MELASLDRCDVLYQYYASIEHPCIWSSLVLVYSDERREEGIYVFGQAVSLSWDVVGDFEDLPNLYIVHCGSTVQIQCVAAEGRTFTLARII